MNCAAAGGSALMWPRSRRPLPHRTRARRGRYGHRVPGPTGEVGKPTELFRKGQPDRLGGGRTLAYDVSADGNRFLLVVPEQKSGAQPTVVVLNWFEELKGRSRAAAGTPK